MLDVEPLRRHVDGGHAPFELLFVTELVLDLDLTHAPVGAQLDLDAQRTAADLVGELGSRHRQRRVVAIRTSRRRPHPDHHADHPLHVHRELLGVLSKRPLRLSIVATSTPQSQPLLAIGSW